MIIVHLASAAKQSYHALIHVMHLDPTAHDFACGKLLGLTQ